MPSKLDAELAQGMMKLTRTSWAVKDVIKMPSALARARAQLDAFTAARDAKDESFLERMKAKIGLGIETPNLAAQVDQLQAAVTRLEQNIIDGFLAPVTEREQWGVRGHYTHIALFLRGQLVKPGSTDEIKAANKAAEQAIDITCDHAWKTKWVAYSLKKKLGKNRDEHEPYWPDYEVPQDVEMEVVISLFNTYHQAFTPTEAELKK